MEVLVAYDVSTLSKAGRKRLRQVAVICKNYGQRVQKSLFECSVDAMQYERLKHSLVGVIDAEEDSLRLYRLPGAGEGRVEHFGRMKKVNFDDPLVV